MFATLFATLQWLSIAVAVSTGSTSNPFGLLKQDFRLMEQHQAGWTNMSVMFDILDERNIFSRQSRRCLDPGYGV